jgi:hypothetical protein
MKTIVPRNVFSEFFIRPLFCRCSFFFYTLIEYDCLRVVKEGE